MKNSLEKFGFNPNELLHEMKFTLLENDLPDICADRIDYAIRDGLHLQTLTRQKVNQIIDALSVVDGEFVFNNVDAAFTYSFNFFLLNLQHYGSATEAHFNNDFGNLVKFAVNQKVLLEKDWFSNDIYLINKLKKSRNEKIKTWLKKYNRRLIVYEDTEHPDIVFPKKIRIVDPKVLIGKKIKRLSDYSSNYKSLISEYASIHKKHELPIKVIYKEI